MGSVSARVASRYLSAAMRRRVALRYLFATDKSLALAIRDAVQSEIEKLIPGEFGELYDTNDSGKGWRSGYVSFALQPATWKTEGIIGGCLVRGTYDPGEFRSEAPDAPGPDFAHSEGGGALSLNFTACYYNKMLSGGCDAEGVTADLGRVDVLLDEKERVVEVDVVDPTRFRSGIQKIVQDISSNPPDYAQSEKRKKKHQSPTGSPKSLLQWLIQTGRKEVGQSEIDALANAMSARTGKPLQMVKDDIKDFFRKGHWPIDPRG